MEYFYFLAFLPLAHFASVSEIASQDFREEDYQEKYFPEEDTAEVFEDIDPEDNLYEDDFETEFGLDKVTDTEEKERRQEALIANEELVKKENQEFLSGKKTWWDKINDFADLPEDEYAKEKTGEILPKEAKEYGRGLLEAFGTERIDEASERYFDKFRYGRADVAPSFSSVQNGNVSPVKNQHQCGSCAAFSNMALVEICFKKLTGVFGDYSEQEFIDCGFGENGALGCNGAFPWAYVKTWAEEEMSLTHESLYPYLNQEPRMFCPNNLKPYNQGAKVTKSYYTYAGDEETMKKLVIEHGAVVTSVCSTGPFEEYEGGVFSGCTSDFTDHAVAVVGYGTDNGVDYWLIKNSWGPDWGEQGYIRLKRGVKMCGIGKVLVTVSCGKVDGPTDAPLMTAKPCDDKYLDCPELAKTNCHGYTEHCVRSCGLCEGMTPHPSNTCWDEYNNCAYLAKDKCYKYGKECCISCGLGEGMTPAASNSCYDKYTNCAKLCKASGMYRELYHKDCKKSCGEC